MSLLRTKQNNVLRTHKEVAGLLKKIADEKNKESTKLKRVDQIQRSINKNTTASTFRNKQQQLVKLSDELAKISSKIATLEKNLADKNTQLYNHQDSLRKEEDRERKKVLDADKKREREQLQHERAITNELRAQKAIASNHISSSPPLIASSDKTYDAFISHASEDKDDFVRPLAEALISVGFKIWYDEMTLKVGDSLRQSIDGGLAQSRFGIVVFSGAFFKKNWTQYELNGLVNREMEGGKVILPIWHKVSKDEVRSFSPSLADKVAINSSLSSQDEIVQQLSDVLAF